jgi:hypothetical protein
LHNADIHAARENDVGRVLNSTLPSNREDP